MISTSGWQTQRGRGGSGARHSFLPPAAPLRTRFPLSSIPRATGSRYSNAMTSSTLRCSTLQALPTMPSACGAYLLRSRCASSTNTTRACWRSPRSTSIALSRPAISRPKNSRKPRRRPINCGRITSASLSVRCLMLLKRRTAPRDRSRHGGSSFWAIPAQVSRRWSAT